MNDQHRLRSVPRTFIGPWVRVALVVTVVSLLLWSVVSMAWLTLACWSYWWLCWIPAVATNGVAAISTHFSMLERVDPATRRYAVGVAVTGVSLDVAATASQHFLALEYLGISPTEVHPGPYWGWVVGGLPSLMAGLLIHIIFRICAQARRDQVAAERERIADAKKAREKMEKEAQAAAEREYWLATKEAEARTEALRISRVQKEGDVAIQADRARAEADKAEADRMREQRLAKRSEEQDQRRSERNGGAGPKRGPRSVQPDSAGGGPDVTALVPAARAVADRLAAEGKELNRVALVAGLRSAGQSCSTERAGKLLKVLRSDDQDAARTDSDRRPLRAVVR